MVRTVENVNINCNILDSSIPVDPDIVIDDIDSNVNTGNQLIDSNVDANKFMISKMKHVLKLQ